MLDSQSSTATEDVDKTNDVLIGLGVGATLGSFIALLSNPGLALLAFLGLFGIVFGSLNLHLGLGFLVFISYARLSDIFVHYHNAPSIAQPLVVGLLLLVLVRGVMSGIRFQGLMKPICLMGIYVVACLTSLLSARAPEMTFMGIQQLTKDIVFALTLILLMQQDPAKGLTTSLWALMLSGLLMGSVSVFQYLTQSFDTDFGGLAQAAKQHLSGTVQSFRISGPIGDPNFFAQILLVCVPLAIDRVMHEKRPLLRVVSSMIFLSVIFSVLFTFSRGALIGLAGMLAIVLIKHRPSKGVMIAGVSLSLISLLLLPENYLDRLASLFNAVESSSDAGMEDSLRGRISELVSGLLMFVEHPLFGVGLGNYPVEYQDYAQRLGYESRHSERHAHNMFLEWLAETGLFGGAALVALIKEMLKRLNAGYQNHLTEGDLTGASMLAAFRLGLLGYLIASLFLHAAFPRYFWLFAALAIAIPYPVTQGAPSLQTKALRFRRSGIQ